MSSVIQTSKPTGVLPGNKERSVGKGALKGRVCCKLPLTSVLLIGAIALVIFGALVGLATAAPSKLTNRAPEPPVVILNNSTCRLEPSFNQKLTRYISSGKVEFEPNNYEIQARALNSLLTKSKLNETRREELYQKYYEAARSYLALADRSEHPEDHAVVLHKARELLKQADETLRFKPHDLQRKMDLILLSEVTACAQAAKRAETPTDKLAWIFRGIKESNLQKCEARSEKCKLVSSLWADAGDVYSSRPHESVEWDSPIWAELILKTNIAAAAVSYTKAAYFGNYPETGPFYAKAFQSYKRIDLNSCTPLQQATIQENALISCYKAWKFGLAEPKQIYEEALAAQSLFGALSIDGIYFHAYILRATYLDVAAYFAPNLEESVDLYKHGRDILETLWENHPEKCLRDRDFTNPWSSSYAERNENIEASLLGHFRTMVLTPKHFSAKQKSWWSNFMGLFS